MLRAARATMVLERAQVPAATEHACNIYTSEAELSSVVASFLAPAFREGGAVLQLGTRAHVAAIEQRLRTDGCDVAAALARGRYHAIDAERVLPHLLRDGMPTAETFESLIGVHLTRLAEAHGSVRVFGELVSLLLRDGKRSAALRVEELWNEALQHHPVALVCGYAERTIARLASASAGDIVRAHTRLI